MKLHMMCSLSRKRQAAQSHAHTSISSSSLLLQLCKTEQVQGTTEQEGQTLSNYPSNCTAKGVCGQHEASHQHRVRTWARSLLQIGSWRCSLRDHSWHWSDRGAALLFAAPSTLLALTPQWDILHGYPWDSHVPDLKRNLQDRLTLGR